MQMTYQKLGTDHPMYGKVEFLVADGTTPLCYKTKDGYIPLEAGASAVPTQNSHAKVNTRDLYVLSFKMNGETEEETFTSKKKLDKTIELYQSKEFITDIRTQTFKVLAD